MCHGHGMLYLVAYLYLVSAGLLRGRCERQHLPCMYIAHVSQEASSSFPCTIVAACPKRAGFGTRRPARKARSVVWKNLEMRQKRVWQSPPVRHSTDGGTSDIDLCTMWVLTHLSMPTHPIAVCDHMFPLFGCQPIYRPKVQQFQLSFQTLTSYGVA